MKIIIVESSPHKKGSSNLLADNFIKGAEEKGHEITVFDAGHSDIRPCLGCSSCSMNGTCVQKDDMSDFQKDLLNSDMVVFVTPLYYFGVSAQLKTVIDRFYNINLKLTSKNLKSVLIVAAWDDNSRTMKDIKEHYLTICKYLNFENKGMILGFGCGTVDMTSSAQYPNKAYELGRSL